MVEIAKRFDSSEKVTKKTHLIYDRIYRINKIIRSNAYLLEDLLEGIELLVFLTQGR